VLLLFVESSRTFDVDAGFRLTIEELKLRLAFGVLNDKGPFEFEIKLKNY
jgi:hypothetical protein